MMTVLLLVMSVIFAVVDGMQLVDAGADASKATYFGLWAVGVGLILGTLLYKKKD